MKKIILLAMVLFSVSYCYSVTPRQLSNIYFMKFKDKHDKDIVPYGKLEYVKTIVYENGTMNLYRITEDDGKDKIIIGYYVYGKFQEKDEYLVIPIFENVYDETFKSYMENANVGKEEFSMIILEVTNQLLKENKLNYFYKN